MARLIDSDKLKRQLSNPHQWTFVNPEVYSQALVDMQPEYNPWRKIDDVEGLEDATALLVWKRGELRIGVSVNTSVVSAVENPTHYMVIPEPPKVEGTAWKPKESE